MNYADVGDSQQLPPWPEWLAAGLVEVAPACSSIFVATEDVIHDGKKSFPWAVDCLEELIQAGTNIVLLHPATEAVEEDEYTGSFLARASLERFGLTPGKHYSSLLPVSGPEIQSWADAFTHAASVAVADSKESGCSGMLAVCASVTALQGARAANMDTSLICTGSLSEAFDLSPAPKIDVPADGGQFNEPEEDCWEALQGCPPPKYYMACFSFSASFFLRICAERRANALRAHAKRRVMQAGSSMKDVVDGSQA